MATAEETIKDIIVKIVHCDREILTPEATFQDMKADSLDMVQVLVALEDEFGIEIPDEEAQKFKNFGDPIFDNSAEAAEVSLYDSNLSVEGNLELKLRDVNDALDRIKKGNFGKCGTCGKNIDNARLEASPTAKLCMDCAKTKK